VKLKRKKPSISVLKQRRTKSEPRSRQGYDKDGLLYTATNVMDFINSEHPESILGDFHEFLFDDTNPECKLLLEHTATDEEIKSLLKDLKVLGKVDFRKLLKWRNRMTKYLNHLKGIDAKNNDKNLNNDQQKEEKQEKSFEMMTEEEKEKKKEDDAIRAEVRAIMEKKTKRRSK